MARETNPIAKADLLKMYRKMALIRQIEETLRNPSIRDKLPDELHLSIGHEAVAVGVCAHLHDRDWIASTHRSHGHFLAKGGDPKALLAEIYGRATGVCKGMGGPVHIADVSLGIIGANGVVGAGIPLAAGAALSAQLTGKDTVAVAFFGDGAANQGVLMEALNLSALWKLPLILVCENNSVAEANAPHAALTAGSIAARAHAFGIPGVEVDGSDIVAVWQEVKTAINRARAGEGPSLIEARIWLGPRLTRRIDSTWDSGASEQRESDEWRSHDPLARCRRYLFARKIATDAELQVISSEVAAVTEAAAEFARSSPWPEPEQAFQHMFA